MGASFPPHLLLLLLILLPVMLPVLFTSAQVYRNVSLGSSLSPLGPTISWVSPSGEFAFGFLPFPLTTNNSLFVLGIWFDKIPEKALVWSAKAETPLLGGAKLELSTDGQLKLSDHTGNEVWSAGNGVDVTHAAMLDNGNFILASRSSTTGSIWESFQDPTDTILPTQQFVQGTELISHLTETDYSDGRFKLSTKDGNLSLFQIANPTRNEYYPYWKTEFNVNSSVLNQILRVPASMTNFYQRRTLDPDGVFRLYTYPRTGSEGRSTKGWSIVNWVPTDICSEITGLVGGACGYNAYCITDATSTTTCLCPPGYSFFDPSREYKGCRPSFPFPSCEGDQSTVEVGYEMVEILNIDWPYGDYEAFAPMDEDTCKNECMKDCFCALAILRNGSCWKKKLPFTNGRKDDGRGSTALLKIRGNDSTASASPSRFLHSPSKVSILIGSLLIGISMFFFVLLIVAYSRFLSSSRRILQHHQLDLDMLGSSLHTFTYRELEEATQGFKEELGRGAFGVVYKGTIPSDSRLPIAVKMLNSLQQGAEKEFTNEVKVIGQTHHKNLVKLLGFCNEGPHRLLVYEFMSKGSLMNLLSSRLDWNQRIQIVYGIGKGLMYLHEECDTQIIHCDIKPQNVLLDDHLTAKISDFGLAKLMNADQTHTSTGIRGTRGYVAPEWFKRTLVITTKVDVYSFGVMLLEIICCRKNVEMEFGEDVKAILTDWAYDCYKEEKLGELVDNDEEVLADMRRLENFVMVALWCIQEDPTRRPFMRNVVQMLDGVADVSSPPDPSYTN